MNLGDLAKKYEFTPTGILHVGASMLEEAEQYRDLGISKVIWIEALPHSERRYDKAKEFGHELYEGTPFSDKQEEVTLRMASNGCSSSILPFHRHSVIYPEIYVTEEIKLLAVPARDRLRGVFPPEINTLVVDTQGSELKVIKGMGELLDQIDIVICEVCLTELYAGAGLKPAVEAYLVERGFSLVEFDEVLKDEWGDVLFLRNP